MKEARKKSKPKFVYLLWFDGSNPTNAGWISYSTLDAAKANAYNEDIYKTTGMIKVGEMDDDCKFIPIKRKKK